MSKNRTDRRMIFSFPSRDEQDRVVKALQPVYGTFQAALEVALNQLLESHGLTLLADYPRRPSTASRRRRHPLKAKTGQAA